MKILHTSDWHFGIYLERSSRHEEQKKFIDELDEICEREDIDLIIIAGDIYDVANPPSIAQKLFYDSIFKLTRRNAAKKSRVIVAIAGNHDSPERLCIANTLMYENGAVILGVPADVAKVGDYGFYKVTKARKGVFELEVNGEKATIATMPFPSEKRLGEVLSINLTSEETKQVFSQKVKEIFDDLKTDFKPENVNIFIGHFHIVASSNLDDERNISFGGSYAVDSDSLPKEADYIAMGHLHKLQKIANYHKGYYCGTPIKYSLKEKDYNNSVLVLEKDFTKETPEMNIKQIELTNYKPIIEYNATSIEDALNFCTNNQENSYLYLTIQSHRALMTSEYKTITKSRENIVKITVNTHGEQNEIVVSDDYETKSIFDEFLDFYMETTNSTPTEDLRNLFAEILTQE